MPEYTEDDGPQAVIAFVGPDGEEIPLDSLGGFQPSRWTEGQPLPHTSMSFDDPMGRANPGEWRKLLTGAAREAVDVEELTRLLLCTIGRDMVRAHGVPAQAAFDGTIAYAKWLYGEYHDAG